MKLSISKKDVGLLVAILLKNGVKSLQKMLIQFCLLAKKAVLLAYKRRYSVLNRLIIIHSFVSDAMLAIYRRISASSQNIDVLAYLPLLRSLLLKLITFQLFKQNNSLPQATDITTSRQYTGGFNFFSHRIQLSISKKNHHQTTGNQPTSEQLQQEEEHATTAPAEEAYLSMHLHHTNDNSNDNDSNTTSPVKATMTTLPPLPKSPGLNALAKYSKMDTTPRGRTKDDTADDDTVQHKNRGDSIPAVLFP